MSTRSTANPEGAETRFNRSAWLALAIAVAALAFSLADLAYRLKVPTDGWEVNEANDSNHLNYTADLMGSASGLQPGDQVIAIEGIPADWQTVQQSAMLRELWQAGRTLDYTLVRDGEETHVSVTLAHWDVSNWLLAGLRDPGMMAGLLSGFVLLALAGFVILRRPGNPAAGAFLIFAAFVVSTRLSETLPFGFPTLIDPGAIRFRAITNSYFLSALLPFALIRFALVFPRPKPIHLRHPWLPYGCGVVGLFLSTLAPQSPANWFWFVGSIFLAVIILVHNAFTMRDAVSRAQLAWGLGGVVIGFGTLALMFLAGTLGLVAYEQDTANLIFTFATTVMGGMLAVSILRYRLFDIDVIIRKTLVYAVVTALLGLVYAGSVILLQRLFETASGQQSPLAIVLSTLFAAALFAPLRRRVQDGVDRRFFRSKVDAAAALAAFAEAARDETDLDDLTRRLAGVVQETMQPDRVSVWLKELPS